MVHLVKLVTPTFVRRFLPTSSSVFISTISHLFYFVFNDPSFGCAESSSLCGLFSSCGRQGLLSRCGAWASHCGGLSCCRACTLEHGLRGCGARAQLLCGMWDLPGSGIEPMSPALAGGFFTTEPSGKPLFYFFFFKAQNKV